MHRIHPLLWLCGLASLAGFAFSAVSTADFVAHLDRQVHGIHCSFLPGLAPADTSGESGCHATLMSPYSSVFRDAVWGGIPVALPSMAVFAFLAFCAAWLGINGKSQDPRATSLYFLASVVPLTTSLVMGYLSFAELDAACKLCIGIYAASGVLSLGSLFLWLMARKEEGRSGARSLGETSPSSAGEPASAAPEPMRPVSWMSVVTGVALGVASVGVSVAAYAAIAPDYSNYVGSCGTIPHIESESGVLLDLGPQEGRPRMLEVFDPLCPSCRGLEERLSIMPERERVDRQLLLFPLDESCNWMIDRSIHPGACSVSEAILCAEDPHPVIAWAFENQKNIIAASERDPSAAATMARARFPALASCIGSPDAEAKLNQSLRWAVKNQLPILTPQVFVEGIRLCGEDTDLGLDYALPRLIELAEASPRPRSFRAGTEVPAAGAPTKRKSSPPALPTRKPSSKQKDELAEPAPDEVPDSASDDAADQASNRAELAKKFEAMQEEDDRGAASTPPKAEAPANSPSTEASPAKSSPSPTESQP